MIQKFKRILLNKYLNWRLSKWKSDEPAQNFSAALRKVKHILIVIPENMTMDDITNDFIPALYEVFGPETRISTFERSSFRQEDSNWLGLPKNDYLQIFQQEKIDLVIDLNQTEDKFCVYVCALINAPLKVNLAQGAFDHIYNLHIRSEHSTGLEHKLKTLVRYFKTLMGKDAD